MIGGHFKSHIGNYEINTFKIWDHYSEAMIVSTYLTPETDLFLSSTSVVNRNGSGTYNNFLLVCMLVFMPVTNLINTKQEFIILL